ncbi:MAG: hypothetical protein VXW30_03830 [Candidatus Thermoplasmatota archaeon]|nr:hypothetical protein [Candidatus Thermoplasmatota archaeon]
MDICFVTRSQSLRIGSAVIRAFEFTEHVHVIQLEDDETERNIAIECGANVFHHSNWSTAPEIANSLKNLIHSEQIIVISLDDDWRLSNLPLLFTSARTAPDILLALKMDPTDRRHSSEQAILEADSHAYSEVEIQHAICSKEGLEEISKQDRNDTPGDLPKNLRVLVIEVKSSASKNNQQSLTTISGFSKLLYWMLESKHPLILFGIPGAILFWVGFQMADQLVNIGGPHDTVGVGVALAAFAATLVGVFAITASMILFVLSKQVERIQAEFSATIET